VKFENLLGGGSLETLVETVIEQLGKQKINDQSINQISKKLEYVYFLNSQTGSGYHLGSTESLILCFD
jgi:hypothetical protein